MALTLRKEMSMERSKPDVWLEEWIKDVLELKSKNEEAWYSIRADDLDTKNSKGVLGRTIEDLKVYYREKFDVAEPLLENLAKIYIQGFIDGMARREKAITHNGRLRWIMRQPYFVAGFLVELPKHILTLVE